MTEPIWNDEGRQMVVVRNRPLRAKCGFPRGWAVQPSARKQQASCHCDCMPAHGYAGL